MGELTRAWPGAGDRHADEVLDAVFDSLGPACVHRLVAAPHPFGLPPRDRRAAQRWLMRRNWARRWKRDLVTVLALVALGLLAALVILAVYPSAGPASDAVRRSTMPMAAAGS